uniref:EGF-like domain-containing protein n=1 Tax=Heterorhabditis bacteriophora TaxID=37862 RepID=A0A1I7WDZ6_HETBA
MCSHLYIHIYIRGIIIYHLKMIDLGVRTFFQSGSTISIEWFTSIPHMGGIRLEVLNSLDQPIAIFNDFNDRYNITDTNKNIELPPLFECADCAIRLTHQATEYGSDYYFYSCADVNILKAIPDGDSCLSHGKRNDGKCLCNEGFTGDYCQYSTECNSNDECSINGECKITNDEPKGQCFCSSGRYGRNCEKNSDVIRSPSQFNESLYKMKQAEDNKIYWRIIGDCAPNEIWTECPEMSRDCEASCDWTRFPETIPNCPRACGAARCVCKEGFVRITNDEDACVPFNFCDNETEPSCPTNTTWAKCGTACEPSCSNMYDTAPCPASCNKPTCTCADNYVRFEGKCIYWGDCPDLENHFHLNQTEINVKHSSVTEIIHAPSVSVDVPMVTRPTTISSRNLSCAVNETVNECGRVCEADCVSIFTRRECDDCGRADCACIQGYARNENGVCVYWGDCPIEGTGLYTRAPSLTTTTQILKKEPKQENPKVNGDVCYGEFRYPAGCKDCDYKLLWNYVDESDEIEFSLESKIQTNSWAGVGFSRDGSMVNADMLIIKSISGQLSLHDMTSEGYGAPVEDQQQDLKSPNVIGTHANGVLRAQFVRKRNTGEAVDKQFDTECWMMMFPVSGGKLDASGNITAHITTPLVSDKEVCIRSCREQKKSVVFPTCEHSYQYPFGCQDDQCEYTASWEYDSAKKDVYFEITSKNIGRWTGIGFSRKILGGCITYSLFFQNFNFISTINKKQFNHQNIFPPHPSYPTRCTEGLFWRECLALAWMLLAVWGIPMNQRDANVEPAPMVFSECSCGTHFPSLRIFPISCNRLETVVLSTANCYASPFRVCDGFSTYNDFKASVFAVRGISERCRSLTSNSPALKRWNQYLQVPWERTASPSTEHIDFSILPLLELVENTVSNMQLLMAHLTSFLNGVLTANFSRELSSDDKDDINLQQCIYLLYTPAGGRIERNGEITKHGETPKPSKTKICLNTCSEIDVKNTKMTTSIKEVTMRPLETTSGVRMPPLIKVVEPSIVYRPEKPVKVRYGLHVRILNRDFVPALADPQTQYYQSFTKDVASAINGLLAKRWKGMQVSKIFEYTKGSVVASFEVVSVNDIPRALEIQSLVEENAIRGHIGGLAIEPSTVKTNEIGTHNSLFLNYVLEPLFQSVITLRKEYWTLTELTPAIVEEAMMNRDFVRNLVIIGVASISPADSFETNSLSKSQLKSETYPVTHPAAHPYGTCLFQCLVTFKICNYMVNYI